VNNVNDAPICAGGNRKTMNMQLVRLANMSVLIRTDQCQSPASSHQASSTTPIYSSAHQVYRILEYPFRCRL